MEQLNYLNGDPLEENCDVDSDSEFNSIRNNAVDFLDEVRSPCLICSADVEIDIVVKQEVGDFEENSEDEDGSLVQGGGTVDHRVFHWFLKWFGVDILGKKGNKRVVNRGWDGNGGDILRFCANCKLELIGLLELQKQLDELDKKIKNGLVEVKGKMERSEGHFQSNKIYERDDRYKRVRSRIIKCGNSVGGPRVGRPRKDLLIKPVEKVSSRKSSRKSVPVSRFNPTTSVEIAENNFPEELMVPSCDQVDQDNEDQLDIKPDIQIEDELDSTSNSPRPFPTKTIQELVKKKSGTRKAPKSKKKAAKKPKPPQKSKRTLKVPKAHYSADLNDDDNYYLDDNPSSSSDDDDTDKLGRDHPQRKKRKLKDEDFILEENPNDKMSSEDDDDDNDLDWSLEPRRKYKYKLDPTTNLITLGPHTFTLSTSGISSNPGEKVSCTACNAILKHDKTAMWRHITKYHTNRFTCPNYCCSFKGASMREVRRHFTAIHEGVPQPNPRSPCRICGKPIQNTKRCKTNHEWTHLSQQEKEEVISKDDPELLPDQLKRKWQCDECGKGFHVPSDLKRHKERYHSEGGYQQIKELCAECGETFVDLEGHRKRVHGVGGRKGVELERFWECTEKGCGKRFRQIGLLTKHKNAVHRGIRPWGCNLCTRSFVKEEGLKKHLKGHLGVREWRCEVGGCGAAFVRKAHLQRHTRIYHEEGAKPRRKVFLRGPTVLGVGFKKEELQRRGTYYPPSALKSWAKGRVPGHLMGVGKGAGEGRRMGD